MAVVVAVAVAGWMLSGLNRPTDDPVDNDSAARDPVATAIRETVPAPVAQGERGTLRVAVVTSYAKSVTREVKTSARTEPNRRIEIRAEVEGRVIELDAKRGRAVREGEQLVRIDLRDREARLAEAEALIAQHRLQYEAAQSLQNQNLMSEVQIAEARAKLVASEAELADVKLEIGRTRIEAPFDAVVQEREIEMGDFVRIGDTLALLVDIDPIIVVGEISEREISSLSEGATGHAELVDGQIVEGFVRYIAPVANENTRTYRVELAVPNPNGAIRAGMTAELRLAADSLEGHLLASALLTLDDTGVVGVKAVDDKNRVQFQPVEILRTTEQGIWVTGLPAEIRIIAVGQGFVDSGALVEPVPVDLTGAAFSSVGAP